MYNNVNINKIQLHIWLPNYLQNISILIKEPFMCVLCLSPKFVCMYMCQQWLGKATERRGLKFWMRIAQGRCKCIWGSDFPFFEN